MNTKITLVFMLLISFLEVSSQSLVSVTPGQGTQGTTLQITLTGQGTHFNQATYTAVYFSQGSSTIIYPNNFQVNSATEIQSQFSFTYQHPAGYYAANVFNFTDGWLTLPNSFLLQQGSFPPAIATVSPSLVNQGQSLSISITGQNTHFAQGTSTAVWFSQGSSTLIYPSNVTVLSDVALQSNFTFTYQHPTGYYDVNTYNDQDGQLTLLSGLLLNTGANPPSLVSLSPVTGYQGDYLNLYITGQNTHFQQSTYTVSLYQPGFGVYPVSSTVLSDQLIKADYFMSWMFPLGWYSLMVENIVDGIMGLNSVFQLLPSTNYPVLLPESPDTLQAAANTAVPVYGQNTHFAVVTHNTVVLQGSSYFYDYFPTVINDTMLIAHFNLAGAQEGYYSLRVQNDFDIWVNYPSSIWITQNIIGIGEHTEKSVPVYPNPSSGLFYADLGEIASVTEIECLNAQGQVVYRKINSGSSAFVTIDLSDSPPGIYFLVMKTDSGTRYAKLLKQ
ncbi:MAG: T9SS type A sorting domain-containing protein [Bacteroidales bacterium]